MKYGFGLFIFSFSFNLFADQSQTLFLRARVPASYSIQVDSKGKSLFTTNSPKGHFATPKIIIKKMGKLTLVSVIHP